MPTVNGDFQNQADVVQTEEFGFKVTLPTITANQVISIDADAAAAPEDGAVVAVDTSTDGADGPVELTIEPILPGAEVKVVNVGGGGVVTLTGDGVTINAEGGLNAEVAGNDGAVAELRHVSDGEVYASGSLTGTL